MINELAGGKIQILPKSGTRTEVNTYFGFYLGNSVILLCGIAPRHNENITTSKKQQQLQQQKQYEFNKLDGGQ